MTDDEITKLARARDALDAAAVPPPISLGAARALKAHDNRQWTPVECLQDAINDIETGKTSCTKLFIVRVNDADFGKFDVGYNACNIKGSEMIAAVECIKAQLLTEMGYHEL